MEHKNWTGFAGESWKNSIDVRAFIQDNYTFYDGDEKFLSGPTERTAKLLEKFEELLRQEQEKGGVLDVDTEHVSSLTNYQPSYLDKDLELIVGYQTEKPLTRGVNPFGGIRMARSACEAYGYRLSDKVEQEFRRDAQGEKMRRDHWAAGRLRPRPHYRGLPPGGPLRYRPADRRKETGQSGNRHGGYEYRYDPPKRGAFSANRFFAEAKRDGGNVRL